jgi:prolyl-tRNA synthetase
MGALVMTHGDDNGLVLPPKLAPIQVVMVPIFNNEEQLQKVLAKMTELKEQLVKLGISVKIDDRDNVRSGFKFSEWELKGVPVRLAIGPRDLENGTVEVARRDTLTKESMPVENVVERVKNLMDEIQKNIYDKALANRESKIYKVDTWDEFKKQIEKGGFLLCHWDGTKETEAKIQEETKATIRCIPVDSYVIKEEGKCVYSGKPSHQRVIFARAY